MIAAGQLPRLVPSLGILFINQSHSHRLLWMATIALDCRDIYGNRMRAPPQHPGAIDVGGKGMPLEGVQDYDGRQP